MTDETKPAEATAPAFVHPAEVEPSRADRIKALLESYAHGMESNSPRHAAELAEIKALLAG